MNDALEKFSVKDEKGTHLYYINNKLIEKQKINDIDLEEIKSLHSKKNKIFNAMKNTDISSELKQLSKEVTKIEFALQKLWGFSEDETYHRFWYSPKCLCPIMDNNERVGTKYFIINGDCPVHGSPQNVKEENKE